MNLQFSKYLQYGITLAVCYFTLIPSANAGIIVRSPAYLGLNRGLVGCWTFDGTNTKVQDCSGNNNLGTYVGGAKRAQGKLGQAVSLDGVDDSVDVGNESRFDFDPTQPLTFSAWIYIDPQFANKENDIIIKAEPGNFDGYGLYYRVPDKDIVFNIIETGTPDFAAADTVVTVPSGQWVHVVATKNSTASSTGFKIYIDGINREIVSNDNGTVTNMLNDHDLFIGDDDENNGCCNFGGDIDDVRIYNRELSAAEIARLYRIGLGSTTNLSQSSNINTRGLVGCWNFDGTYTKVPDCSGNNRTGTLMSGPIKMNGKIGQAVGLNLADDGGSDYINLGTNVSFANAVSQFSISSWVKMTNPVAADKDIVQISINNGGVPTATSRIDFAISTSSTVHCGGRAPDSDTQDAQDTTTTLTPNIWYHVVCVIDVANDAIYIYINGVLDSTGFVSFANTTTDSQNSAVAAIGAEDDGSSGLFYGLIDDVRLYNRALSASEINNIYQESQSKLNSSKTDSLTNGLMGYWTLDGADTHSNGKTDDKSGKGLVGTINGATRVQGKVGQALSFDGINDTVTIPNFDPDSSGTVSFWMKSDRSFTGTSRRIIGGNDNWEIGLDANADTIFGDLFQNGQSSTTIIKPGAWTYITYTYVGTTSTVISLYVNGVLDSSFTAGAPIDPGSFTLSLGDRTGANNFYPGLIDDVRIYNRALSASEVNKLYQMGR